MLRFKSILTKIGLMSLVAIFTQCASGQKMDKTAPVEISGAYYQKWVSGIKEGGHGIVIYIPVKEEAGVTLTEVYFQGKRIALERKRNEPVYVGKFTDPKSIKEDMVMSDDPKEEFKNQVPGTEEKIPFELKDKECVIAYAKGEKNGFFKMNELPEKKLKAYPMSPRQ